MAEHGPVPMNDAQARARDFQQRMVPCQNPAGFIRWHEHMAAFYVYAARYGTTQSAQRIADRGGFGGGELRAYLGHDPVTFVPKGTGADIVLDGEPRSGADARSLWWLVRVLHRL